MLQHSDSAVKQEDPPPPAPNTSAAILADAQQRRAPIRAQSAEALAQIKAELPQREAEQPIPRAHRNRLFRYVKLSHPGKRLDYFELEREAVKLYEAGY